MLTALGNFCDLNSAPKSTEVLHYYTPEQFIKFIGIAESSAKSVTDWGYYVFFSIAFYTGARKGEINMLKWSDIDGNVMHIRRSIAQKLKGRERPLRDTSIDNKSKAFAAAAGLPHIRIHDYRHSHASLLANEGINIQEIA